MKFRLSIGFLSAMMFGACGGGSSGGDDDPVDAGIDGSTTPDAPPGVSGLGQKCDPAMQGADCPANAPACIGLGLPGGGASTTYCTPTCVTGGTATGAANNQLANINPAPNNGACQAANSSGVGMGICAVILAFTPMDNPIVVDKNYTDVALGCVLACGAGDVCPTGMSANNQLGACVCFPD